MPIIKIRDASITFETTTKFLGVLVDNKLNFSVHIGSVCKRICRSIGIMKRLKNIVPNDVLQKLYYSMAYPYVTYGIEIWGDACKTQINRLSGLLDKCINLITIHDINFNSTFSDFSTTYKYYCLIKLFKYYRLSESNYFKDKLSSLQIVHNIGTRSSLNNNLNIPLIRSSKIYSSFYYNSIKLWNKIPSTSKNFPTLQMFKTYLRKNRDVFWKLVIYIFKNIVVPTHRELDLHSLSS